MPEAVQSVAELPSLAANESANPAIVEQAGPRIDASSVGLVAEVRAIQSIGHVGEQATIREAASLPGPAQFGLPQIQAMPSGPHVAARLESLAHSKDPNVTPLGNLETRTVHLPEGTRREFFVPWLCGCNVIGVVSKDAESRSTVAMVSHYPASGMLVDAQVQELEQGMGEHSPSARHVRHDIVMLTPGHLVTPDSGGPYLQADEPEVIHKLLQTLHAGFEGVTPTLIVYDVHLMPGQSNGFVLDFPARFEEPVRYDGRHGGQFAV